MAAPKKEGRLIGRGERGGAQTKRAADGAGREGLRRKKRGGRWCGARGADATERGAADGAGREERRPNKDGRLKERGERKGGETKRAADVAGCRRGASDGLEVYRGLGGLWSTFPCHGLIDFWFFFRSTDLVSGPSVFFCTGNPAKIVSGIPENPGDSGSTASTSTTSSQPSPSPRWRSRKLILEFLEFIEEP